MLNQIMSSSINIIRTDPYEGLSIIFPVIINKAHEYYLIYKDQVIVGLFEIQPISKITGNLHMHILEKYQKQRLACKSVLELKKILKNSDYKQLIGTIPANNLHSASLIKQLNAHYVGMVQDGIIWNNILTNLLIYQLEV